MAIVANKDPDRRALDPGLGRKVRRVRSSQPRRLPYLLIMPALMLVCVVTIYPALYAAWLSFQDMNLLRANESQFVGLRNYVDAWHDDLFRLAVWKTIRWTVVIIALQMLIALPMALFLNMKFRGRSILRSIVLVPYVMPAAVVAVIWVYMFNANFGVVNRLLVDFGVLDGYRAWFSDSELSFGVLVLAMVWQGTPLMAVILLAALQALSREVYEAAQIDGANRWQRFRHVTLPQLMPTIWLLLLLRTMWMSQHVDLIFLLTNGGPGTANYTLSIYSFNLTIQEYKVAYASAIAIILSVILMLVGIFYLRLLERAKAYL